MRKRRALILRERWHTLWQARKIKGGKSLRKTCMQGFGQCPGQYLKTL